MPERGYPGSKNGSGVAGRIISLMPAHETYVAGFAGHDAIFFRKHRATHSFLIDPDPAVSAWWAMRATDSMSVIHASFSRWSAGQDWLLHDPDTLLYLDPPYLRATRSDKRLYLFEMDQEADHAALLRLCRGLGCRIVLSGYWSQLYADLLHDWRAVHFQTMTRGGPREEWVWMNYPADLPLHDCRYVGSDYRERERIKRKRIRWATRFAAMPADERQVIREAIDSVEDRPAAAPGSIAARGDDGPCDRASTPEARVAAPVAGGDDTRYQDPPPSPTGVGSSEVVCT